MTANLRQRMIDGMAARARRQNQPPQPGGYGGGPGGYGWGAPGPRETRGENTETEVTIPLLEANGAMAQGFWNCVGLTLSILAILAVLWLLLYRYGYGKFILFPIFALYVFFGRWAAMRSTKKEDGIDHVINAGAAFLTVATFTLSAAHCVGAIVLPWELIPLAVVVWVVGCWRYCTAEPRGRLIQRYNTAVTDPNYPPMRLPIDRNEPLDIYSGLYDPEPERPESRPLPSPPARAEWVERATNGTGKIHQLELPVTAEKMRALAEHIFINEQPFSETACCRTAGILSQTEYGNIKDWLIASERGFARWVSEENHNAGVVITAKGRALLRAFMPEVAPKIVSRQLPTPSVEAMEHS